MGDERSGAVGESPCAEPAVFLGWWMAHMFAPAISSQARRGLLRRNESPSGRVDLPGHGAVYTGEEEC